MTEPFRGRPLTCPHGRYWASCWCRVPALRPRPGLPGISDMIPEPFTPQTSMLRAEADQRINEIGGATRPQPAGSPNEI